MGLVDPYGPLSSRPTRSRSSARDPNEFWQFQVGATRLAAAADRNRPILFLRYAEKSSSRHPVNARWLIYHARMMRGEKLLQIVRMLDKQMNNTSVILLFQIGN